MLIEICNKGATERFEFETMNAKAEGPVKGIVLSKQQRDPGAGVIQYFVPSKCSRETDRCFQMLPRSERP